MRVSLLLSVSVLLVAFFTPSTITVDAKSHNPHHKQSYHSHSSSSTPDYSTLLHSTSFLNYLSSHPNFASHLARTTFESLSIDTEQLEELIERRKEAAQEWREAEEAVAAAFTESGVEEQDEYKNEEEIEPHSAEIDSADFSDITDSVRKTIPAPYSTIGTALSSTPSMGSQRVSPQCVASVEGFKSNARSAFDSEVIDWLSSRGRNGAAQVTAYQNAVGASINDANEAATADNTDVATRPEYTIFAKIRKLFAPTQY